MEKQRVTTGLYRIYWKTGRASLVSIGMGADGEMWFAPTNWIAPENRIPWEQIESYERLDIEKEPSKIKKTETTSYHEIPDEMELVEFDWNSAKILWIKNKAKEFEDQYGDQYGIVDAGILNKFMTFILNGEKKFPYIEGDKLIFDMGDKASRAAISEYAKASVFHGHGSEAFIGHKCNELLKQIGEFQKGKR